MTVKICHASDLHGSWPKKMTLPKADLYVLTGDLLPDFILTSWVNPKYSETMQAAWCYDTQAQRGFRAGLANPDAPVVIVRGNHDFFDIGSVIGGDYFEVNDDPSRTVEYFGLKFGGIRGVPGIRYTNWNDMFSDREFEIMLEDLPEDLHILLTHTPPYNVLDDSWGRVLGSQPLRNKLDKMTQLKLHCFGHIHESCGVEKIGNTVFSNAATGNIVHEIET